MEPHKERTLYTKEERVLPDSGLPLSQAKALPRDALCNTLNFLHFIKHPVQLQFRNRKYQNVTTLDAIPRPCSESTLAFDFIRRDEAVKALSTSEFAHILVNDGMNLIMLKPRIQEIRHGTIVFTMGDSSAYQLNLRGTKRYRCSQVKTVLLQDAVMFSGDLVDFNSDSFRVDLSRVLHNGKLQYLNLDAPVTAVLSRDDEVVYSGAAAIAKQKDFHATSGHTSLILTPAAHNISRFRNKDKRSIRTVLVPSPDAVITHPLTGKTIFLKVLDISGSGTSVEEDFKKASLFPGLILPSLEVVFGSHSSVHCRGQVLHRNVLDLEGKLVTRFGIAFLDIPMEDQARLANILHQAENSKTYVCSRLDIEDLWRFFFEHAFFYPRKYLSVHYRKDEFIRTYEKLYLESHTIARHFIYREHGDIQGHISMLRTFSSTWLFHHHVGDSSKKAGIAVLQQISRYVNDFHNMPSTHLRFITSYFRPENRFPVRVFGGLTEHLKDKKKSSLDEMAYIMHRWQAPAGCHSPVLVPATAEHLEELRAFYEKESGGLTLDALDLLPETAFADHLTPEYEKCGFQRDKQVYALKEHNELCAVFLVINTDASLNLSSLTNCIHAFVIDPERLDAHSFNHAVHLMVQRHFPDSTVPVLLFPVSYADRKAIPYDKKYFLWTVNTMYQNTCQTYFSRLFGSAKKHHG